jgi:hypothetical protein
MINQLTVQVRLIALLMVFYLNTVGIERIILPRYTIEWRFYGLHDVLGRMGYGGLISAS